jgi:YHS domain-containing protein
MSAELGEEDRPLTKGETGDFCPITLRNESYLFPGLSDFEASVKGRMYKFAGEKELEEFKIDPMKYIYEGFTQPPQPHFMIVGARGSGVST